LAVALKTPSRLKAKDGCKIFSRYVPQAIIQDFISGYEVTDDIICDLRGQLKVVIGAELLPVVVKWHAVSLCIVPSPALVPNDSTSCFNSAVWSRCNT
jgi:hypothetical protein